MATSWAEETFAKIAMLDDREVMEFVLELAKTVQEDFHIDFKQANPLTPSAALHDSDLANLAKCLSGFSNSAGGLVVWGIENQTRDPVYILDVKAFEAALISAKGQCVEPYAEGAQQRAIKNSDGKGILVLLVPASDGGPHMVRAKIKDIQHKYLHRVGDSFQPMEHWQLEDRFGRRPRPKLLIELQRLECRGTGSGSERAYGPWQAYLGVRNVGTGLGKHLFGWLQVPKDESQLEPSGRPLALRGLGDRLKGVNVAGVNTWQDQSIEHVANFVRYRMLIFEPAVAPPGMIFPFARFDFRLVQLAHPAGGVSFHGDKLSTPLTFPISWMIACEGAAPNTGTIDLTVQ